MKYGNTAAPRTNPKHPDRGNHRNIFMGKLRHCLFKSPQPFRQLHVSTPHPQHLSKPISLLFISLRTRAPATSTTLSNQAIRAMSSSKQDQAERRFSEVVDLLVRRTMRSRLTSHKPRFPKYLIPKSPSPLLIELVIHLPKCLQHDLQPPFIPALIRCPLRNHPRIRQLPFLEPPPNLRLDKIHEHGSQTVLLHTGARNDKL